MLMNFSIYKLQNSRMDIFQVHLHMLKSICKCNKKMELTIVKMSIGVGIFLLRIFLHHQQELSVHLLIQLKDKLISICKLSILLYLWILILITGMLLHMIMIIHISYLREDIAGKLILIGLMIGQKLPVFLNLIIFGL